MTTEMDPIVELQCPHNGLPLTRSADAFSCPQGSRFPIVGGIPRFVPNEDYAGSFGHQWKEFRLTQLDSHSGVPIFRERMERMFGGSLDILNGKTVLEAGCGAGTFTEIFLEEGARVFAVDLSTAVEANYENFAGKPGYFVCQANLLELPVAPEQFDVVWCGGVLQHTPDPEESMDVLFSHLKPGGLLVIDHYAEDYILPFTRRLLRKRLLNKDSESALRSCRRLMPFFWPGHRFIYHVRRSGMVKLSKLLQKAYRQISPFADLHMRPQYKGLSKKQIFEWMVLVTHDTVTDVYKHIRTKEEIEAHLSKLGMLDIVTAKGGNGAEARATKPG